MPVLIVPPVMVRVGDLLYGPDAKRRDWRTPRLVIGEPMACEVVEARRCWPAIWRFRQVRVVGYLVELRSDTDECGDFETLHAATVRVER